MDRDDLLKVKKISAARDGQLLKDVSFHVMLLRGIDQQPAPCLVGFQCDGFVKSRFCSLREHFGRP